MVSIPPLGSIAVLIVVRQRVLCLTGSSFDANSITFFVLQSPIIADV